MSENFTFQMSDHHLKRVNSQSLLQDTAIVLERMIEMKLRTLFE